MKTIKNLAFIIGFFTMASAHAQYEVAFEIETVDARGDWVESSEISGFSGDSYYYWSGETSFTNVPSASVLSYTFDVPSDGSYRIYVRGQRIRGKYGCPSDAENDRCNDIWLQVDNNSWTKKMIKQGWGNWIWDGKWEPEGSVINANITLTKGTHTLKISGRSYGTMVDAVVLTKNNSNPPTGTLDGTTPVEPGDTTDVDCIPLFENGLWQGKGRIAISSDGNEHDHDDWAATPLSLALLASQKLQDKLVLYTFSDHVWGSNHDHPENSNKTDIGAKAEMLESALVGKEKFGFDNSTFIEAVENPDDAYNAMRDAINASSADDPLFIIGAGPMHVIGEGMNRAEPNKLQYVTAISHSQWNERHSDNPNDWESHNGWTWDELKSSFSAVNFIDILDQNGEEGEYEGMRAPKEQYYWIKTSSARNDTSLYKAGSWDWLYERQEAVIKSGDFDPSDAGMVVYLLTGVQRTNPNYAKDIMENNDTCKANCTAVVTLDGYTDFTFPAANDEFKAKGSLDNNASRLCAQINTNQQPTGEWARATAIFAGETGEYYIGFNSLLESDGESQYRVKIDGEVVLEVTNIRIESSRDYEIYSTQTDKKVTVNHADEVQVEFISASNGLVVEGDGYAWARARWKSVEFLSCGSNGGGGGGDTPVPVDCVDPEDALGDGTNDGHTVYAEMSLPGTILVENFDDGGQGISYEDKGYGNNDFPDGSRASWSLEDTDNFREDVLLDIHTKNTAEELFLGGIKNNEWAEYTFTTDAPGDYTLTTVRYSTNNGIDGKAYFKIDDSVSCTYDFPNTGGATNFTDITIDAVFEGLSAGEHVFAWVSTADKWNLDQFTFTKSASSNIAQHGIFSAFKVYPNPFSNNLMVQTKADNISIYNITGQLVPVDIHAVESGFELNTCHLAKGMYFIKAGNVIQKVIKE